MKKIITIIISATALCGSVQAGPYDELLEDMKRQRAVSEREEILRQNEETLERLEEIERQQEKIRSKQRRLERDSTDYWGRPWQQ